MDKILKIRRRVLFDKISSKLEGIVFSHMFTANPSCTIQELSYIIQNLGYVNTVTEDVEWDNLKPLRVINIKVKLFGQEYKVKYKWQITL